MEEGNIFLVWLPYIITCFHQFSAAFIYSILCSLDYVPCAVIINMSFPSKRFTISMVIMALGFDFLRMEKGHAARLGLVLVRAVRHLGVKSLLPLHAGRKRFTLAGRGRSGGRARAPPEATRPPPPSPRGVTPPRPPPRSEGAGPARVRASGAAGAGPRSAARRGQPAAGCGRGRGRRAGRARPGSCAPLAAGRRRRRARECRAPERAAESAGRGGERPRPGPRDPPPAREPRLGLSGSEVDGVAPVDGHAARPARSEGPSALEASGGAAWRSLLHGSQHVLVGLEFTAAPEK